MTPSSSLRHVFFRDLEVDIAEWDRAHLVHAPVGGAGDPVLRELARRCRATDGVASAHLQLPPGDRPAADAARVRELVAALRAVLVALDPAAAPYR